MPWNAARLLARFCGHLSPRQQVPLRNPWASTCLPSCIASPTLPSFHRRIAWVDPISATAPSSVLPSCLEARSDCLFISGKHLCNHLSDRLVPGQHRTWRPSFSARPPALHSTSVATACPRWAALFAMPIDERLQVFVCLRWKDLGLSLHQYLPLTLWASWLHSWFVHSSFAVKAFQSPCHACRREPPWDESSSDQLWTCSWPDDRQPPAKSTFLIQIC